MKGVGGVGRVGALFGRSCHDDIVVRVTASCLEGASDSLW